MLFGELDDDRSGHIDQKELYYRLTGLKQFDFTGFKEDLSDKIKRQGIFLLDFFKDVDPRGKMMLSEQSDLNRVLRALGLELSEDHLNQLFTMKQYSNKGHFSYIDFML